MYRLAGFLLLVARAWPQFPEITTTDDGLTVYITSEFNLKSAPPGQRAELRAFAIDASGNVQLFAERGSLARSDASGSGDGVSSIHVTGDGSSVAFVLSNICLPSIPCTSTVRRAEIRGADTRTLDDPDVLSLWLSRNGQWLLLIQPPVTFPNPGQPPVMTTEATLVDLTTNQRIKTPLPATRGNPLASDGTVVVRRNNPNSPGFQLGLFKGGDFIPITGIAGPFSPLALSDDGGTLLYQRPAPAQLVAHNLLTGSSVTLHSAQDGVIQDLLGLSSSGDIAFFRLLDRNQAGSAVIANTRTADSQELTLPPRELPASGALSGNGRVALLITNTGRLLRFDLDPSGKTTATIELVPPTPFLSGVPVVSPGELIQAAGALPAGFDWTGRILLNGAAIPIIASNLATVTFQAPWELIPGPATLRVDISNDSPFSGSQSVFAAPANPRFVPADPGSGSIFAGVKIIRGDFSGPLTTQPGPGDVVHIYMTGLGSVAGAVQTGKPAPADDIRPITGTITCRFLPQPADAQTLFAGLAPLTLGYYLASFRMPADAGTSPLNGLRCQFQAQGFVSVMRYQQASPPSPLP